MNYIQRIYDLLTEASIPLETKNSGPKKPIKGIPPQFQNKPGISATWKSKGREKEIAKLLKGKKI